MCGRTRSQTLKIMAWPLIDQDVDEVEQRFSKFII